MNFPIELFVMLSLMRSALALLLLSSVDGLRPGGCTAAMAQPLVARAPPAAMLSGPELIESGVSLATFAPQPFWVLLIAAPRSKLTESIMGPIAPIVALSLVHLTVVLLAASAPGGTEPITIFADVFDPAQSQLDGMQRLFAVRDFVAEEWPHVLIWDLFVGRAIWLDGVARGVSYMAPSLLLTNLIGPPGLVLYVLTCLLTGKGLPPLGYTPSANSEDKGES